MEQETQSVLEMLRDGKITPEEAAQLLEALDTGDAPAATVRPSGKLRTLHINVTDARSGRSTVKLDLPFGLVDVAARLGLSLGIKRAPELADLNFDEILAAIRSGAEGHIVDIDDDDHHQHVAVSVD